jgi:hypothetical protein
MKKSCHEMIVPFSRDDKSINNLRCLTPLAVSQHNNVLSAYFSRIVTTYGAYKISGVCAEERT